MRKPVLFFLAALAVQAQTPIVSDVSNDRLSSSAINPGAVGYVFGANFGALQTTSVVVGGLQAQVLDVTPRRIRALFPPSLPLGFATLTVTVEGHDSATVNVEVAASSSVRTSHGRASVGAGPPAPLSSPRVAEAPKTPPSLAAPRITAGLSGSGIVYTCDPTITAASTTACNTLNTTIAGLYSSAFTNANASIYITLGNTDLGESEWLYDDVSYTSYRSALSAAASGANAATAVADSVPAANPFSTDTLALVGPLERALGMTSHAGVESDGQTPCNIGTTGCYDGVITISNNTPLYFRSGSITNNQYDFFTVVEHETDEVLGTASCAIGCRRTIFPADYFRYHSNGARSLAAGTNDSCSSSDSTNACFSFDAVTMQHQYNNVNNGLDAGDWVTNCNTPFVQDAELCSGTAGVDISPAAEILVLNVIGYTLRTSSAATPVTIQTLPSGLQFSVDGGAAQTAPQTLNLTQGTHSIAVVATQSGAAGTQYVFAGWSDSGAASHNITVGSSAVTYTASFQTQYQLTISASPSAGGTVTPATGTFYNAGTVVSISATAKTGYSFTGWTGTVANASNSSTTATMNAALTLVANFSPNPTLTIAVSHTGSLTFGQTGAIYNVTVSNTAGARSTSGTVTVTEAVPAGATLVSMAGTGWTCATGGTACTRSDALAGGAGYPAITVTVNIASNAPAQITNKVSVSGGGSAAASASDTATLGCTVAVSPTSPAVAGTAGTLALTINNGSCGWSASSSASWLTPAAASGTSGTLNVAVAANSTGAQRSGTLTVAGQAVTVTQAANIANQIPSLTSLSPFQGQGSSATFTFVYSHPNGWAAIQSAQFIMNPNWEPGSSRAGGCYVQYAPGTQQWTLIADDGVSIAGTASLGAATALSNSQCSLLVGSSSVTGSGTTLTVVASLAFTTSFTGQRHIWMEASDYNNLSTNWLVYGVWFPNTTAVTAEPWYQIYDPFAGNWLYSADPNEYSTLGTEGFTLQGPLGLVMNLPATVAGVSNIIWYRAFVNATSSHFWTSDRNEFLTIINQQSAYVGEGVAAFVMPYINAQGQVSQQVTNTVPFYRGVFTGANLHYWTVQTTAFNPASGYGEWPPGYVGEGIACYIFPNSGAQFSSRNPVPEADAILASEKDDGSPAIVSVSNGASYVRSGVVAPGQVLTIHGRHLGSAVLLNGVPAEVVSARENEIRIVAPESLAGGAEVSVEVVNAGRRSKAVTLRAVAADPAIFVDNVFGRGIAQATNADGTTNSALHAARRGSVVTLYTTGYSAARLPMEAHIAGVPAEILSAHVSATRPGVTEVHVRIPQTVAPGPFQPVVLRIANLFTQPGAGLAIQ